MVIGPHADDRTIDVINGHIAGSYNEDIALRLLLPMKYKDRWVMRTERSLNVLSFKGAIAL